MASQLMMTHFNNTVDGVTVDGDMFKNTVDGDRIDGNTNYHTNYFRLFYVYIYN